MELTEAPGTEAGADGCSEFMTPLEELKALRKEVKSLRSASCTSSASGLLLSDQDSSSAAVSSSFPSISAGASANVVDSNKLNQRLKEMFRERISSYREAVYLLLGYKVSNSSPPLIDPSTG
jgi:2-methylisocitrate lyase-like PEP mutase family enzyme